MTAYFTLDIYDTPASGEVTFYVFYEVDVTGTTDMTKHLWADDLFR
jgi:hypothetical protein